MTGLLRATCRRWGLFAAWLVAGLVLSTCLLLALEPVAWLPHGLPLVLEDLLAGPLMYWRPVLMGHPPEYDLSQIGWVSTWVYAGCVPLAFAHPVRPSRGTAGVSSAAFLVWYSWATYTFVTSGAPY